MIIESVLPGLFGSALLGDRIRPGWHLPFAVGLLLAAVGVAGSARAPAQAPQQWRRHYKPREGRSFFLGAVAEQDHR